ncbi:hypothetical protein LTR56_015016 [Elasticomyces elasticus]|nr:hypothetical protein LTR56_015016 [Elasticomyces elasticus]KAK3646980.1 hypothetical protein LTR22_014007 [Elasticomyces elasticus]KAK4916945.1 hypothetical protein LTR49_015120 [Elasticomyces elasticus]KAK5754199.1 hypothetical protein LTS12_015727 [Elasticomyces elasticus]
MAPPYWRICYVDGSDAPDLIANGLDGYIVRTEDEKVVRKIPKISGRVLGDGQKEYTHPDEDHREDIEYEKRVYERLAGLEGVTEVVGIDQNGISMVYYPDRDLENKILGRGLGRSTPPPSLDVRRRLAVMVTTAVAGCHDRVVLWFDVALRNVLLDGDSVRLCDFANSMMVEPDVDIAESDEAGYTLRVELLHLTNLVYSIMTWTKSTNESYEESEWPDTWPESDLGGAEQNHAQGLEKRIQRR